MLVDRPPCGAQEGVDADILYEKELPDESSVGLNAWRCHAIVIDAYRGVVTGVDLTECRDRRENPSTISQCPDCHT